MEQKLMEKKAVLEVLEDMLNNYGMSYDLNAHRERIREAEESIREEKENGGEVGPDDWRIRKIKSEQAYLDAYETVKKHLEKLI